MKKENRKLPGLEWRILSFVPGINWISLIYIGWQNSSVMSVICGGIYGALTFAIPSVSAYLWIIAIIQYAFVYRKMKKFIGMQQNSNAGKTASAKTQGIQIPALGKNQKKEAQRRNVVTAIEKIAEDRKTHSECKNGIDYTDIVLSGGEEKKQSIPLNPIHNKNPKDGSGQLKITISTTPIETKRSAEADNLDFEVSYSDYASQRKFMTDMAKYADKVGEKVPFVPFMQYWPTYESMDKQQRAWYFYWRTQVRNKNYVDTDLSYIFVYVYELLSGYGWREAEDGYQQLLSLWMSYRESFPKLDSYLFAWTFDFAQIHNLEYSVPDIPDIQLPNQLTIRDVLIDQHSGDKPLKLSFALIDALCDYSLVSSKFYKDGHQALMQEAIPRVVALADAALLKKGKRGILAAYGPNRTRKQSYYVFQSAVCPDANKRVDISVKAYTSSQKLRNYINELVRYGENILRALYGCRGRLRGVTLDEETANLIEAFLKKEYTPAKRTAKTTAQKIEVNLNFDSIDVLRTQSDAVRDALDVPEESVSAKEALTDLQEVMALLVELTPEAKSLLDMLFSSKWECVFSSEMSNAIDEINKQANKYLACALLVREHERLIVEDDYRDELDQIYAGQTEVTEPKKTLPAQEVQSFDLSVLSAEMQKFIDALSPVQEETLHTILTQRDALSALSQIAEEAMTMPEILIDEINDVATQFLDDILIDALGDEPCVLDQYEPELRKAIK